MNDHILYIKDNSGKLRYWACREVVNGLEIEYGAYGGSAQFQYEDIDVGLAGRSIDEQIESRIQSRVNKQLDKGYVYDIKVAECMKPVNSLGFVKPMLAKKSEDVDMERMMSRPFWLQNKLDGNRCMVHNCGELVAYTRNGKEFKTLEHILAPLRKVLPSDYTLDGEMYVHGVPLQTLVSWGKRLQPDTLKLQYHVYDLVSDSPVTDRLTELGAILRALKPSGYNPITPVFSRLITPENRANFEGLGIALSSARSLKYEGLIFRSDYALNRGAFELVGYEDGKRSGSLIKIKDWDSKEFKILDIRKSADEWAVLQCENPNGPTFWVSCPGDMNFKRRVLNNKQSYIGKMVTVKFAYYTADGVPFQPVAEAIRDYE